jgi:hypothetical protein
MLQMFSTGNQMISLKGVLYGIGLSFVATFIYFALIVIWFIRLSPSDKSQRGTAVGIDVISIARSMVHSPAYWLFVLISLAAGCAIVYVWHGSAG